MIDKESWMQEWARRMTGAFGGRLRYLGLQGSYRRGEAHEGSDFDVVTILDRVQADDLRMIRSLRGGMPEQEKACGFLAGEAELRAWPPHELFQFRMDTEDYYGALDALLPPVTAEDTRMGLRVQAANLYHMVCHTRLYGAPETQAEAVRSLYKAAFFALQLADYLETGVYSPSKGALLPRLRGDARTILEAGMDMDGALRERTPEELLACLGGWCSRALCGTRL